MNPAFRRSAISAAILVWAASSALLSPSAASAQESSPDTQSLKEVTITGNPLGSSDLIAPAASYSGDGLTLRRGTTLGDTLDGTPGVSATYFGPNASRPIIRGQDGDRIRILQNSGATLDASALSYDHAVPIDPLTIERIEVLRGPGALQYGGSAVGGVVNVIDNRIPTEPLDGVTGRADLGAASGNHERSAGVLVEGGNDRFALHVDAFDRHTQDVEAPVDLNCENPATPGFGRRICNSASSTHGGAVGGTMFFDHGYLGASASTYRSNYGTVAEDDVLIGMQSDRYALEGLWRNPTDFIESIKAQFGHTSYEHTEYEGGEPGTRFSNGGNDLRLEVRHAKLGPLEGMVGWQSDSTRFSAVGDEAFAPFSRTRSNALFVHEELPTAWGRLSFGARTEQVKVESFGNPDVDRFAPDSHSFNPHSAAVGALVRLAPQWQLTSNLAYTERAPKDYELYANGPHVATAAWETGDTSLQKERSTNFDIGAGWKDGPHKFNVNAYISRFGNYIGLVPTGDTLSGEGERNPPADVEEVFPEYAYHGVRARFTGLEANGTVRLLGAQGVAGASAGGSVLDLDLRGDLVRATNLDTGEPLPRIAPARVGATLAWAQGPWGARAGFDHLAAQNRIPDDGSRATDAYTLWNAAFTYKTKVQAGPTPMGLLWYARVDNITNKLAYSATSILTSTAFPKSPLPGRSFKVGLQANF
ncbi:MAG TPA: TonB-dependent receptor [Burkholderiaceae bacterium]